MKKSSLSLVAKVSSLFVCLSLVLSVVSPLLSMASAPIQADLDKNRDGVVNYVVLGSYDAVGFGVSGYDNAKHGYENVPEGSYADLLRDKIEETGKSVKITPLGIGGMRAEEIRYLLDSEYAGDDRTEKEFVAANGVFSELGGVSELRDRYIEAVKTAEVITLDIGFENFTSYVISYVYDDKYNPDFTVFTPEIQDNVSKIKNEISKAFGGSISNDPSQQNSDIFSRVINGLTYALVGYCCNFDAILGRIYDINPSVELAVTSVRNPITGRELKIDGLDIPISLDDICGIAIDMANVYMATLTEYKDIFAFAYYTPAASSNTNTDKASYLDGEGHKALADKLYSSIIGRRGGSYALSEDMNESSRFLASNLTKEELLDIENILNPYYACDKNSYYVALGDGSALGANSYPTKLVNKLVKEFGFNKTNSFISFANKNNPDNKDTGIDESPYDTLAALKKSKENGSNFYKSIVKADLITLTYTNLEVTRYMIAGDKITEADWNGLKQEYVLSESFVNIAHQIIELLKEKFDGAMGNVMIQLAEKYLYAYSKRALSYIELVEYIYEVNPKAQIVAVGTYNELKDFVITYNETEIPFGKLMQTLSDMANFELFVHSIFSGKASYISVPEIETIYEQNNGKTSFSITEFMRDFKTSLNKNNNFLPSQNGHAAIENAVLSGLKIVGEHDCEYDNICDLRCNICKQKRTAGHTYSAVCDTSCNSCGAIRPAVAHSYYSECDPDCNLCGETRVAGEHTYSSDCDIECDLCKTKRETAATHSFGEAKDTKNGRVVECEKCGYTQPAPGLLAGVIVGISVGSALILGVGGFSVFWFVIKKKTLADIVAIFAKK